MIYEIHNLKDRNKIIDKYNQDTTNLKAIIDCTKTIDSIPIDWLRKIMAAKDNKNYISPQSLYTLNGLKITEG